MELSREFGWREQKLRLMEVQDGRCGACRCRLGSRSRLDHDHATGMTRGLLCPSCNTSEGYGSERAPLVEYRADPPAADMGWEWQSHEGHWALDEVRALEAMGRAANARAGLSPDATADDRGRAAAAMLSRILPPLLKETP